MLYFAGLWDEWIDKNQVTWRTCTIITTELSEQLEHIHSRIPAILNQTEINEWIDCRYPYDNALRLLKPYKQTLDYYPVTSFVNSAVNNSEKCIETMLIRE